MITIRVKRTKSEQQILAQMDRILNLYLQGYGSRKMLDDCDTKVYIILSKMIY
jgi:hypothetical protein